MANLSVKTESRFGNCFRYFWCALDNPVLVLLAYGLYNSFGLGGKTEERGTNRKACAIYFQFVLYRFHTQARIELHLLETINFEYLRCYLNNLVLESDFGLFLGFMEVLFPLKLFIIKSLKVVKLFGGCLLPTLTTKTINEMTYDLSTDSNSNIVSWRRCLMTTMLCYCSNAQRKQTW